jgi:hypothetical protein
MQRIAFTTCLGDGGCSAASEMDAQDYAETVSESWGSGNRLAPIRERAGNSRTRPLWLSVGVAALVSLLGHSALAQASSASSADALARARVRIVNRQHQEVPETRVRVLLLTTCRVVAEEFHRHPDEVDLKLTLVMGDRDERSMIDKDGNLSLYMDRWNEGKFVDGVITGAVQQLTTLRTRQKMFTDILRRTDGIAPVSVNQLRGGAFHRPLPGPSLDSDGVSPVREAPWSLPNRTPPHR